jgi:Lipocalin-like domain
VSELRHALVGAWHLESFVSRDEGTGLQRNPFGDHPAGLILYTPDGYMSAQLTPESGSEYIAYTGAFTVDEQTAIVHHDVVMSNRPGLLKQPQYRHARVDADRLTLSATQTSADGSTTRSTLVWRRAQHAGAQ